jgi:hypothetical protein
MPNTVDGGPPLQQGECPFCERTVLVYEDPPRCPLCACPIETDRLRPYLLSGGPGGPLAAGPDEPPPAA